VADARRARHGDHLDRLALLEEERRFLLRSLDDLERERAAGDVGDQDYETLRDGYTARAAAVLREIESGREQLPPRRPRRRGRTVAIWVTVLVGAVAAGLLVARSSGERLPDDPAPVAADQVSSLLTRARQLQLGDPVQAIELYSQVLDLRPGDVEALTYRGWTAAIVALQLPEGDQRGVLIQRAESDLAAARASDPTYADAACFGAIVAFRLRDDAPTAKTLVDQCTAANPPAVVASLVDALRDQIDAALG
jgi:hypothetical protein